MALVTPMARGVSQHATPNNLLCDLEALVASLEESFVSSEVSVGVSSPGSMAKLQVEKERRQQLIRKISQVFAQSSSATEFGETNTDTSLLSLKSSTDGEQMEGDGTIAWKRDTLIRLRKFLKKKYRQKKSELIDSASKSGCTPEWLATEKSQIVQIAADIRSIDLEIRILSGAKTVVQHGKLGSSSPNQQPSNLEERNSGLESASNRQLEHSGHSRQHQEKIESLNSVKRNLLGVYPEVSETQQQVDQANDQADNNAPILEADEDDDFNAAGAAYPTPQHPADLSESSLSSGNMRHMAKIERPNLRTVKRNLLSCYDEAEDMESACTPAPILNIAAQHKPQALMRRGFADDVEGCMQATTHQASKQPIRAMRSITDSPGFEATAAPGAVETRAWTDVDLSRWAIVSKVAVSPVVRTTLASPMPVVLQHRVLAQQPPAGAAIDMNQSAESLHQIVLHRAQGLACDQGPARAGPSHAQALVQRKPEPDTHMDSGDTMMFAEQRKEDSLKVIDDEQPRTLHKKMAELPALNVGATLLSVEHASPARSSSSSMQWSPSDMFDHSTEAEAVEGDAVLLRTLIKILSGPRQVEGPLTSRYRGSDPDLLAKTEEYIQIKCLAQACVRELPLSCLCEGRKLLEDFEPFPLHETVAHSSAELLRFVHAKEISPPTSPFIEQTRCNKILQFELAQDEIASDNMHVQQRSCNKVLEFDQPPSKVKHLQEPPSVDSVCPLDHALDTSPVRLSQIVAKRLNFNRHELDGKASPQHDRLTQDHDTSHVASSDSETELDLDVSACSFSPGYGLHPSDMRIVAQAASPTLASFGCSDDSVERGDSFACNLESAKGAPRRDTLEARQSSVQQQNQLSDCVNGDDEMQPGGIFSLTDLVENACAEGQQAHKGSNKRKSAKKLSPARRASPKTPQSAHSKRGGSSKATPSPTHVKHAHACAIVSPPSSNVPPRAMNRPTTPLNKPTTPMNRPTTPTPHRRAPFRLDGAALSTDSPKPSSSPAPLVVADDAPNSSKHKQVHASSAVIANPPRVTISKRTSPLAAHASSLLNAEDAPSSQHEAQPLSAPQAHVQDARAEHNNQPGQETAVDCHAHQQQEHVHDSPQHSQQQQVPARSPVARRLGTPVTSRIDCHRTAKASSPESSAQCVKPFARAAPGPGLNNKTDLMSSIRLARKGPSASSALASGPRRVLVVQDKLRTLKPLPPSASSEPDAAASPPEHLSCVGGKRVTAPLVVGSGVTALHPCSAPPQPRQAVDQAVLLALQLAAKEKLANYRNRMSEAASSQADDEHV